MSPRQLAFAMLGLGFVYLLANAALGSFVRPPSDGKVWIFAAGVATAAPVALAMFLIARVRQTLAHDEYRLMLFNRHAAFAAGAALLFLAIQGFYDVHSGGLGDGYSRGIFFWFVMWFVADFRRSFSE
jgi:hypothetical protein